MTLHDAKLVAFYAFGVPCTYLVAMVFGRLLKRRAGVQLGIGYRIFCIALAFYLPLALSTENPVLGGIDIRKALGALSVVFGATFVSALVRRYVWEFYFEKTRQTPLPKLLQQLVEVFLVLFACVMVLHSVYGRTEALTSLIAGSSAVAVIVGFAMQNLLGNVVAGLALEVARPFRPGDWLMFDGQLAEVMEVNWRSTKLRTNDDIWLDIPNNLIVSQKITNLSFPTRQHSLRITVGIDYHVPPNVVKEVLIKAAASSFGVLAAPAPKAFLKTFGDSSIVYEVKFALEDESLHNPILDSVHTNIWYGLHREGIRIPFPIRTLHIEKNSIPNDGKGPQIPVKTRTLLRQKPFFQCLDDTEMERLLSAARLLRFGLAERIITQGDEGYSMFILLHGRAGVHVGINGAIQQIATLYDGDYFGEISLLTGEPRSATVVAQSDCEVLEIEKGVFAETLQQNPALLERLSALLAERRLETEGIMATTASPKETKALRSEYTARFLQKLGSFFNL